MAKDSREALLEIRGRGSWVDYVQALITKYGLRDVWEGGDWGRDAGKRR